MNFVLFHVPPKKGSVDQHLKSAQEAVSRAIYSCLITSIPPLASSLNQYCTILYTTTIPKTPFFLSERNLPDCVRGKHCALFLDGDFLACLPSIKSVWVHLLLIVVSVIEGSFRVHSEQL
jgi:hypothetical protein